MAVRDPHVNLTSLNKYLRSQHSNQLTNNKKNVKVIRKEMISLKLLISQLVLTMHNKLFNYNLNSTTFSLNLLMFIKLLTKSLSLLLSLWQNERKSESMKSRKDSVHQLKLVGL